MIYSSLWSIDVPYSNLIPYRYCIQSFRWIITLAIWLDISRHFILTMIIDMRVWIQSFTKTCLSVRSTCVCVYLCVYQRPAVCGFTSSMYQELEIYMCIYFPNIDSLHWGPDRLVKIYIFFFNACMSKRRYLDTSCFPAACLRLKKG